MRLSTLLSSVSLLLFYTPSSQATCYLPDGTADKNVEYQPCARNAANPLSTLCCATNRKDGADICAPNGLCQVGVKKGESAKAPEWTKPSCTLQGGGAGCLGVCGDDNYPFLTPCDTAKGNASAKWCCGLERGCCNSDSNAGVQFLSVNFDPKGTSSSLASSSTTSSFSLTSSPTTSSSLATKTVSTATPSASTSTSLSAPSAPTSTSAHVAPPTSETSPPSSSTGLTAGAKAGLGVAIPLFCLALTGLGIWFVRRRASRARHYSPDMLSQPAAPWEKNATVYAHCDQSQVPPPPAAKNEYVEVYEMGVTEKRGELDAGGNSGRWEKAAPL